MSVIPSDENRVVLLNDTTDIPLPIRAFSSKEHAESFMAWCAIGGKDYRAESFLTLNDWYDEWVERCTDEDGELKDDAPTLDNVNGGTN